MPYNIIVQMFDIETLELACLWLMLDLVLNIKTNNNKKLTITKLEYTCRLDISGDRMKG